MFWKKKKQISPLEEDFTFPQPTNVRHMVVYGEDIGVLRTVSWPPTSIASSIAPVPPQCLECDATEITEAGDAYRRFQCVNYGRIFSTGDRAPATGKTARLERRCACGEAIPNEATFCIFCGAAVQ